MRSSRRPLVVALALVVASLAASSACRRSQATSPGEESGQAAGMSAYDAETTDIARVLAGMRPLRKQAFAALVGLQEWRDWEVESRDRWGAAWSDRVQPIRSWANAALTGEASGCQTLLHPFGGTEFLAAYMLFPSCEGYVLVGDEPVGQLPSLDTVTPAQFAGFAEDVRRAFPDVFPKPTEKRRGVGSAASPRLIGAIPSLLIQLARLDARIVSASRFDLTADGRPLESIPIRGGNARPAALSLTFEVPNGRPQSLVYFPADVDDAAMRKRPGAWTFLRMQAPFSTLLTPPPAQTAARCSLLRDLILEQSHVILQSQPTWTPLGPPGWVVSTLAPMPHSLSPTVAVRQKPPTKPGARAAR
jgi:hypothetical protein